ncbi:MAG: DUF2225 domain-containing protein [Clostridiales Family XIII bacterium]|jgi:uncharacterized protein (DUF2225 family)|nr:DUF2225 domain-containing protein [Clostridiales Family XIII bacterium]
MDMKSLLKLSGIRRFSKGQVLAAEGDAAQEGLYIILIGAVETFKNYQMMNEAQAGVLAPGDFFGEASLFLGKPREVTAVAQSDVVALEMTRTNAPELFSAQPEITFALMEGLCLRMEAVASSYRALGDKDAPRLHVSEASPIFPEGHGHYLLSMDNAASEALHLETAECPMCGAKFPQLGVLASKLVQESRDADQRVRFKGLEPMYYEVITCPQCLFSAMTDLFRDIEVTKRMREAMAKVTAPYVGAMEVKAGQARDAFTVFAGYYLAVLCAPTCFFEHQRITARLWRNLSRIYDDCGDGRMSHYALQRAHDEYMFSYSNFDINGKALQQLCYVIGELKYKLNDLAQARQFYYAAFTNRDGTPALKRQAEDRLEELKRVMGEPARKG